MCTEERTGNRGPGEAIGMMLSGGVFGIGNGLWQIIGLVISLAIMALGVAGGIERANKIMMPVLFFLFLGLGVYIFTLSGASEGYKYIFTIKPSGLLNPEVWVYAFGQAFLSLSIAGNGSVIYGSYLSRKKSIPYSARNVAVFDTLAALLAAVVTIGVPGCIVSIMIQPWTSQWMDVVSIYICPLGAMLAGIMFFWMLKKETALAAVNEGCRKPIGGWFYPLGKFLFVPLALIALIMGAIHGGIG